MASWLIKTLIVSIVLSLLNLYYWTTSNIQDRCVQKIENGKQLNLYEKCSIYSIHVAICTFGYIISPEAAKQEFYLTYSHKSLTWDNSYIKLKLKNNKGRIGYKYSNIFTLREALALNGCTIKDNKISAYFIYPKIKQSTNICGFKISEYLLNYLQEIHWLHPYKFTYLL